MICEVHSRVARFVARGRDDHAVRPSAESLLQPVKVVASEVVVLIENGDAGVGPVAQNGAGVDLRFRAQQVNERHCPGEMRRVVPPGRAGLDEELRHAPFVQIGLDRGVRRRAE